MAELKKYRLKSLMNIRKEPSLKAEILGTLKPGTIVKVVDVVDDWLKMKDGTFVLGGEFAECIKG